MPASRRHVDGKRGVVARLKTRKLHSHFWSGVEFTVSTQSKPGINCTSRAVSALSEYLQEVLLKDTEPLCAPDNFAREKLGEQWERMSKLAQVALNEMGQTIGRMPDTWQELMEERDRVIHWSSEVLARVQDNVTNEDTFLMDYDDNKINAKIDSWIKTNQARVNDIFNKYPNASDQLKNTVQTGVEKLTEEIRAKMRKDYQNAYSDIKKFNKKADQLGEEERKIHAAIQKLEEECAEDVQKFQKKFGPLRVKVFDNLRTGEKMMFQDKKLKTDFTKKVYDIDHKISADCTKRFDKLLKDFEKSAVKQGT